MQPNGPFLRVEGITKQFPGVLALDRVSMEVMPGEVHALLGENGAGKSTLIKILTGALHADAGQISINGEPVEVTDPHRALQLGISAIFQDPSLVPFLSVADNVMLGREPEGQLPGFVDRRRLREQAQELLAQLGLALDPTQRVSELSPSYKQLVAIAKALSVDARLIIMDEPTSALTSQEIDYLFNVIRDLRGRGISVIYVSHRLEEIFAIADVVSVLRDGQYIGKRQVAETNTAELIKMIVGRDVKVDYHQRRPPADEIALSVRHISRRGLFEDISFNARRGEIVALSGLVGSGRTGVAQAIFGAEPIDSGEIIILGRKQAPRSPQEAIRLGVGMLPEDRKAQGLVPHMSVQSNITLSNLLEYCTAGLIRERLERERAELYRQRLDIKTPDLQRQVVYLSGGNQQKVVLARILDSGADIVILDEPTAGIDVGTKAEIRALISELAEQGRTILIISSEIPEVMALADRILVMREGRLVGELSKQDADPETILGLSVGNH